MKVYLNRVDGLDDAIVSMYLSKRTLTRELECEIREEVLSCAIEFDRVMQFPEGSLCTVSDKLRGWLEKLFKWGTRHITMLRFIDLSFTVYDLHRGAQDDFDAHAMRLNNRIIRSSTRLADFKDEMSEFYQGKIIPTDLALSLLGVETPDTLEVDGKTYVRAVNGYILKGHENDKDYRRGLYMLSIPSSFIFRVQLTEFAHIYKERNKNGTANPELKDAVEQMADAIERATQGYVTREVLLSIQQ